eukprot:COSAG01_NODE_3346_length_6219_cov_12.199804_3_plen_417_part_00
MLHIHKHMQSYLQDALLQARQAASPTMLVTALSDDPAFVHKLSKVRSTKYPSFTDPQTQTVYNEDITAAEFVDCALPTYLRLAEKARNTDRATCSDVLHQRMACCFKDPHCFEKKCLRNIFHIIDKTGTGAVTVDELERFVLFFCDEDGDSDLDNDSSTSEEEDDEEEEEPPPPLPVTLPQEAEEISADTKQHDTPAASVDQIRLLGGLKLKMRKKRESIKQAMLESVYGEFSGLDDLATILEESELDRKTNTDVGVNVLADVLLGGPARVTRTATKVLLAALAQTGLVIAMFIIPVGFVWLRGAVSVPSREYYAIEHVPLLGKQEDAQTSALVLACLVIGLGMINHALYVMVERQRQFEPKATGNTEQIRRYNVKMRRLWAVKSAFAVLMKLLMLCCMLSTLCCKWHAVTVNHSY